MTQERELTLQQAKPIRRKYLREKLKAEKETFKAYVNMCGKNEHARQLHLDRLIKIHEALEENETRTDLQLFNCLDANA